MRKSRFTRFLAGVAPASVARAQPAAGDMNAQPNRAGPSHLIDVMPAPVNNSRLTCPVIREGHEILLMQGRLMVPAVHGEALKRDKLLFWRHEGNRAVRDGKWKLVSHFGEPWRLFDIAGDRGEMHDPAASRPEIARKMARQAPLCGDPMIKARHALKRHGI
ncbi:hypothetical protein [Niveispirillum sp.]|uniref:hypothetical protein n=1 Tax=Niveispirillum sp. TaxID=1917217 RepID=UPI001B7B0718|nr:hypothetical protein [Niveispirillum sp.]MBP7340297.1 hypothetical protein [Niveispirillum sp.]